MCDNAAALCWTAFTDTLEEIAQSAALACDDWGFQKTKEKNVEKKKIQRLNFGSTNNGEADFTVE